MRRNIIIIILVLALAFSLGLWGDSFAGAAEAREQDRLCGVFITAEYLDLFDFEGYFNDNAEELISGGEPGGDSQYQKRLWASRDESGSWHFEGVEGMLFGAVTSDGCTYIMGDEGISASNSAVNAADGGEGVTLEGTVYLTAGGSGASYYMNPVYQTAEGELYALSGNGVSMGGDISAGMAMGHDLSAEWESTGPDGVTTRDSISISVDFETVDAPEGVNICQFSAAGELLRRDAYDPGLTPESLTPERDCAYIVVETLGGETLRELFSAGDEHFTTLAPLRDGILCERWTALTWPR